MAAAPARPAGIAVTVGCAVVVTVLGACQPSVSRPPAPLPPAPAVVEVTMREFRFDHQRDVPAGRVVFQLRNDGRLEHELTLLPLAEDVPPISEQVSGSQRRQLAPFAGVYPRQPGTTDTFAVDLVAGRRYALLCYLRDSDGTSHARKGMASEFRAGGTAARG